MWLLQRLRLRFGQMIDTSKHIKVDSKFLIIIFFLCLLPICISSFGFAISNHGNMITIRTMFSSILGYLIENICTSKEEGEKGCGEEDKHLIRIFEKQDEDEEEKVPLEETSKTSTELRVLIVGHLLMLITVTLLIGIVIRVDQMNQSLIVLKNTAFSCIGFLVSASRKK